MMAEGDGALLIGDDAMRAHLRVKQEKLAYHETDLGKAWKQLLVNVWYTPLGLSVRICQR